jgi:hypothetical protein
MCIQKIDYMAKTSSACLLLEFQFPSRAFDVELRAPYIGPHRSGPPPVWWTPS